MGRLPRPHAVLVATLALSGFRVHRSGMTETLSPDEFVTRLSQLADGGARRIVALVGAPASGKSTLAEHAVAVLGDRGALVPMDGFHLDDTVLGPRGWQARKGAPHTFDVGGLIALLDRLRANDEGEVFAPRFDRSIEIARAGALPVPASARVIVVEGNWLLHRAAPWNALAGRFDLTAMLVVPEETLRARLTARWQDQGLDKDAIAAKIDGNDLPNARMVVTQSAAPDIRIL